MKAVAMVSEVADIVNTGFKEYGYKKLSKYCSDNYYQYTQIFESIINIAIDGIQNVLDSYSYSASVILQLLLDAYDTLILWLFNLFMLFIPIVVIVKIFNLDLFESMVIVFEKLMVPIITTIDVELNYFGKVLDFNDIVDKIDFKTILSDVFSMIYTIQLNAIELAKDLIEFLSNNMKKDITREAASATLLAIADFIGTTLYVIGCIALIAFGLWVENFWIEEGMPGVAVFWSVLWFFACIPAGVPGVVSAIFLVLSLLLLGYTFLITPQRFEDKTQEEHNQVVDELIDQNDEIIDQWLTEDDDKDGYDNGWDINPSRDVRLIMGISSFSTTSKLDEGPIGPLGGTISHFGHPFGKWIFWNEGEMVFNIDGSHPDQTPICNPPTNPAIPEYDREGRELEYSRDIHESEDEYFCINLNNLEGYKEITDGFQQLKIVIGFFEYDKEGRIADENDISDIFDINPSSVERYYIIEINQNTCQSSTLVENFVTWSGDDEDSKGSIDLLERVAFKRDISYNYGDGIELPIMRTIEY
jgi:hypothetical protein